ncbi:hypothetical protein SETIT_9G578400v2 [Setaria italica]|uniref:Uncharacterized protein n=2 Tax=Setaria TaxID=4554 RepID=A0A368SXA5_SETIT|nr:hypothetical protein SETIT_9G578400v2 [Setaria italica]TKV98765.1 hypothetical protein SEVIR_9G582000v2 [Setaria viridis]
MGSVLSSTYAALCSFVGALLDKVEMWRMMAAYPHLRAEERENLLRWFRDQDAEEDARDAAARLRGRDLRPTRRCNYKHPCKG